jgi:predicted MFS family arabinose efflux permease
MSRGSDAGWTSPLVLILFAVGVTTLGLFIRRELTHPDPMLRLRLFAIPAFRLSLFIQWFGIFSLFGLNVIVPLYLQRVQGMTAAEAGAVLLPMGFAAFIMMNVAGKLYHRLGPRPIVLIGMSVLAATTLGWSFVNPDTSTAWLLLLVVGRGFSLGFFGQIVQVAAYNAIPQEEISRATSMVNVGQRIATAFATAALTTTLIMALGFTDAPEGTSIAAGDAPIDAMAQAFDYAFYLMTAFTVAASALALSLHDPTLEASKAAAHQEQAKPGEASPTGASFASGADGSS